MDSKGTAVWVSLIVCANLSVANVQARAEDVVTEPVRTFGLGTLGSVAYAPDGLQIATCGSAGAFLWDVDTGQLARHFTGHTSTVLSIIFSPDGSHMLTGSSDQTAKLWDTATCSVVRTFSGHSDWVHGIAFSPDGSRVLTGGASSNGAKLWNASTGALIRTFTGHTGRVDAAAFSPDGTLALTGSRDKTAKLWNVETGAPVRTFTGHTSAISCVAFSPDGSKVLTGSNDKTAKLWETASGTLIRTINAYNGWVSSVAFSGDGSRILTGGFSYDEPGAIYEASAKLWDANTGDLVRTFPADSSTSGLFTSNNTAVFSSDCSRILMASSSNVAMLWDAETGATVQTFGGYTNCVKSAAFSPDGSQVLTSGWARTDANLWNTDTGAFIRTFAGISSMSVAFSPDGSRVFSGARDVSMWDAATGAKIRTFTGHHTARSIACSPDGSRILVGGIDYLPEEQAFQAVARLWDVNTGALISTFQGPHAEPTEVTSDFYDVAFSPDGTRTLLAGCERVWDGPPSGSDHTFLQVRSATMDTLIRAYTSQPGIIYSATFSPDGSKILTGHSDRWVKLWDTSTGAVIRTITGHSDPVHAVAFSPDGLLALAGDSNHRVKLWHLESGTLRRTFAAHIGTVNSVAFSPNGALALSGSEDGTAMLWDVGQIGYSITVFSSPGGVVIPGSGWYDYGTSASLTAPAIAVIGGVSHKFAGWWVNGAAVEGNPITLTMNTYYIAEARYVTLRGDVNGDCRVNVLDLLCVRNALNQAPSDDNEKCDVNHDGKINILDILIVRSLLGARCPQ